MTQKENEVKEKYTLYSWTKWIDLVKSQPNHIVFIENTPKEVIELFNMLQKEKLKRREGNFR